MTAGEIRSRGIVLMKQGQLLVEAADALERGDADLCSERVGQAFQIEAAVIAAIPAAARREIATLMLIEEKR